MVLFFYLYHWSTILVQTTIFWTTIVVQFSMFDFFIFKGRRLKRKKRNIEQILFFKFAKKTPFFGV